MTAGEFLTVGRVLAPWGMKGEVKAEVMTEFPERFSPPGELYIEGCPVTIERSRWQKGKVILKLVSVNTVEDAEKLRGQPLDIHESQIYPLSEGQYYQFQLIGLEVWTGGGEFLGNIRDILPTGSNDVLLVKGERGELLIPAIEDVVKTVELEAGRVVVELVQGL